DYPGWALALQQADSHSVNMAGQVSRNRDLSSTINYSSPVWTSALGVGRGKVTSDLSPAMDSINDNWAFSLGRTFSNALPDLAQTWSVGVNFSAGAQTQRLIAGGQTVNSNYTLALTGQRTGWGSVNLLLTSGETTQPNGGPSLRLQGLQLEAVYAINPTSAIKAYVRKTRRNIDDPVLAAQEKVGGLQLTVSF
ncbi:MAG: hypothetical protein JWQ72_3021, partial [Polaromonas sp.]|nr:hypothetical protein [Polaromonas sp.]